MPVKQESKWMREPKCYMMLKEKPDGIIFGALKFPILFADTIYLLPKEQGDKLVEQGYAIEAKPKSALQQQAENQGVEL